jgi:hypothetical protein
MILEVKEAKASKPERWNIPEELSLKKFLGYKPKEPPAPEPAPAPAAAAPEPPLSKAQSTVNKAEPPKKTGSVVGKQPAAAESAAASGPVPPPAESQRAPLLSGDAGPPPQVSALSV